MGIKHANAELVAIAWLKQQANIPVNAVGTTLPEGTLDVPPAWLDTGFIQVMVSGRGTSESHLGYRAPVMTAHCWAASRNKQKPPWNQANDLAEDIWHACAIDNNGIENLTLSVTAAPKVRILKAWGVGEPRRLPYGFPTLGRGSFINPGNTAHYVVDFQIAWAELPS